LLNANVVVPNSLSRSRCLCDRIRESGSPIEHRRRRRTAVDLAQRVAWHAINRPELFRRLVIRELLPDSLQNVAKSGVTRAARQTTAATR
jgi:hypothetical protein